MGVVGTGNLVLGSKSMAEWRMQWPWVQPAYWLQTFSRRPYQSLLSVSKNVMNEEIIPAHQGYIGHPPEDWNWSSVFKQNGQTEMSNETALYSLSIQTNTPANIMEVAADESRKIQLSMGRQLNAIPRLGFEAKGTHPVNLNPQHRGIMSDEEETFPRQHLTVPQGRQGMEFSAGANSFGRLPDNAPSRLWGICNHRELYMEKRISHFICRSNPGIKNQRIRESA